MSENKPWKWPMEKIGVTMMKAATVEVVAKIMEQPGGDESGSWK